MSHGFTAFHGLTVVCSFLMVLQILSRFFSQMQHNSLSEILQNGPFLSLIRKLLLEAALNMAVPGDYQKCYGKHPSSINLVKVAFFSRMICAII